MTLHEHPPPQWFPFVSLCDRIEQNVFRRLTNNDRQRLWELFQRDFGGEIESTLFKSTDPNLPLLPRGLYTAPLVLTLFLLSLIVLAIPAWLPPSQLGPYVTSFALFSLVPSLAAIVVLLRLDLLYGLGALGIGFGLSILGALIGWLTGMPKSEAEFTDTFFSGFPLPVSILFLTVFVSAFVSALFTVHLYFGSLKQSIAIQLRLHKLLRHRWSWSAWCLVYGLVWLFATLWPFKEASSDPTS